MLASHDLDSLNPAQREAVRYGEMKSGGGVTGGPLLVIAGAGTGKTRTAWRICSSRVFLRSACCS